MYSPLQKLKISKAGLTQCYNFTINNKIISFLFF